MTVPERRLELLLVEDSPADARLTEEALIESGAQARLHVVGDGTSALHFLRRKPPYSEAVRPDLILLDLNLPGIDGRDVLRELRQDRLLARIPVLVLSSSTAQSDINGAYDLCANCYITKPLHFEEYLGLFRQIEGFWFHTACLPDGVT